MIPAEVDIVLEDDRWSKVDIQGIGQKAVEAVLERLNIEPSDVGCLKLRNL